MEQKFYLTTPIYYVNAKPHIGHAYTSILADVIIRYRKLFKYKTFFLTGTDEHGTKVLEAAKKASKTPKEYCDEISLLFKEAWQFLNIEYDHFIRTTDEYHKETVKKVLTNLYNKGDIYQDLYNGKYCVSCERFLSNKDIVNNQCPDCQRDLIDVEEKNYFFKMSKYQKKLINHIENHPDFILPEHRKNEILSFLKKPLNDLCISRPKSRLDWGIELPFDTNYVTYVWFDALLNYLSGIGYLQDENKFKLFWPANCHLIGKDILTTHTVYWTTMLLALEIPLPKTILAHGWWLVNSEKMSKSKGNVVNPLDLATTYGVDFFRYFLMKAMTIGNDAEFSLELFINTINSDLANELGNLISRTTNMIISYLNGVIELNDYNKDNELKEQWELTFQKAKNLILEYKINEGIESINLFVKTMNKYIVKNEPWNIAKDKTKLENLKTVLYNALEGSRLVLQFLHPIMPKKTLEAITSIGASLTQDFNWGFNNYLKLEKKEILFPRIT